MWQPAVLLLAALMSQASAAPQFITFNDGKLGVNFGGYHAAVGLGGLLGGNGGAGGGLFAEAGTPYGQGARAGLGGTVDGNGGTAGGLYAGATAGNNVKASAGLAGGVNSDKTGGLGFASAQSGNYGASSGMGGATSVNGASGFTFSGSNSFGVMKGTNVAVKSTEEIKPIHKKPHKEFNLDATNEVNFVPLETDVATDVKVEAVPAVAVKEVNVESPQIVEKHTVQTYYKPRHHLRKTAYIGGYVGGDVAPAVERRIDVGVEGSADVGASASASGNIGGGAHGVNTKEVVFTRNPNFFADIFNIPISTLKAVGNFLGNTAGSTSVSVQKSASVQGESDSITSSKHVPSSSSDTAITVQTPAVSKVIEDIFAIPINTLTAVNKFLENNVPAKKRIQVSQQEGVVHAEKRHARLGPHARRRANKHTLASEEEKPEVAVDKKEN
ncbi:uncharacterized protein LOC106137260 [Amyelois transitella]|uniref:uncharacterized protein LOC106137260 n=1 Tax=Amyelois transitella TaxID=680683 RepID=UPI00067D2F67|nr:uncharacterized protein LOC106137260 [Amyelois transitella]